eukprot:5269799-Pyramimonas_sp.AAC.2
MVMMMAMTRAMMNIMTTMMTMMMTMMQKQVESVESEKPALKTARLSINFRPDASNLRNG